MWNKTGALNLMTTRPSDVTAEERANRLDACENCRQRIGNTCRSNGQLLTVHPLKRRNRCPLGKWGEEVPRSKSQVPSLKPRPSSQHETLNLKLETPRISAEVTIGFTAFLRPACVKRLYESIRRYYPTVKIIVGDNGDDHADLPADENLTYLHLPFDCGISAARNAIVERVETPFLFLCDDDLVFTHETDASRLLSVLDQDPSIGVCGGAMWDFRKGHPKRLLAWAQDFAIDGGNLKATPSASHLRRTADGTVYYVSDTCLNFAMMRKTFLAEHLWEDKYKVQEHTPFYWEVKKRGIWRVAACESVRVEHRREDTPGYNPFRTRDRSAFGDFQQSSGLASIQITPFYETIARADCRPNIVILGIGHSGTSILTKMLHTLGWHRGDADAEYGESVAIRRINEQLLRGEGAWENKVREALASLGQPWAIKDPRFVQTLEHWIPHLAAYRPALIWLCRDSAAVESSYARRGEKFRAGSYANEYETCLKHFREWSGPKIRLDFETLTRAVALFEPTAIHQFNDQILMTKK